MMRATHRPRALLLLVGALVAIAGIVWSAADRPRAEAKLPAAAALVVAAPVAAPFAAPLPAAPEATAPVRNAGSEPTTVAGAAGMRIFKDPETGGIGMPTDAASALESDANSHDMTGLVEVQLPDGSYMIDLKGRFAESMVVTVDAKGNRSFTCTGDPGKVHAHPAPAPAPAREEE